jgi:hypothetical protein
MKLLCCFCCAFFALFGKPLAASESMLAVPSLCTATACVSHTVTARTKKTSLSNRGWGGKKLTRLVALLAERLYALIWKDAEGKPH